MRWLALFLPVAVGVAACGGDAEEQPTSTSVAQPVSVEDRAERTRVEPPRGPPPGVAVTSPDGWEPRAEHLDFARRLADPNGLEATWEELDAIDPNEQAEILRAGLRLPDELAAGSAALVEWTMLDHWEQGRAVSLLIPLALDGSDGPVDFGKFRGMLGSSELPAFLEEMERRSDSEDAHWMLSDVHRQARDEHIEAIARLALSAADVHLREEAYDTLAYQTRYTDEHREVIARVVISQLPEEEREPAPAGGGLPVELRQSLTAIFRDDGRVGYRMERGLHFWGLRWLLDARPTDADAPFLVDLATHLGSFAGEGDDESQFQYPRECVARAMRHLRDPATDAHLRRVVEEPFSAAAHLIAAAALAARGDDRIAELIWNSRRDDRAIPYALALELDPARGADLLRRHYFGPVMPDWALMVDIHALRWRYRLEWDLTAFRTLERAAVVGATGGPYPAVSFHLFMSIPECRTRAVAEALVRAAATDPSLLGRITEIETLAAVDAAAGDVLRALLARKRRSSDSGERSVALHALLSLGDTSVDVDAIAAFGGDENRHVDIAALGTPAVRQWALGRLASDPTDNERLIVAGIAHGLPSSVAGSLATAADGEMDDDYGAAPKLAAKLSGWMLEGRFVDALAAWLETNPPITVDGIGAVDDPRIRAHLERRRSVRGAEDYAWAIDELVRMGDERARAEMRDVVETGRYRWVDNVSAWALTDGGDPARIPFWIEEAASNCCRYIPVQKVFDDLVGQDIPDALGAEAGLGVTPAEFLRDWWERIDGRLVWSHALQRYVPGAR